MRHLFKLARSALMLPLSPRQIRAAARYWREGLSTRAIAERLGVHESVVANRMDDIRAVPEERW
jgi:DNA-binding CsgD family transcriptional regulator